MINKLQTGPTKVCIHLSWLSSAILLGGSSEEDGPGRTVDSIALLGATAYYNGLDNNILKDKYNNRRGSQKC